MILEGELSVFFPKRKYERKERTIGTLQKFSDEEMMSEGGNHPPNDRARGLADL